MTSQPSLNILIYLGIFLFLVLTFVLVWCILKQKPYKALLAFFIIPILMIAFPYITKVSVGEDGIDIETVNTEVQNLTSKVQSDPGNSQYSQHLKATLDTLESLGQTKSNPQALISIAKAHLALGQYDSTSKYLQAVEKLPAASQYSQEINAARQKAQSDQAKEEKFRNDVNALNTDLTAAEANPHNQNAVNAVKNSLLSLSEDPPVYTDANSLAIITRAKTWLAAHPVSTTPDQAAKLARLSVSSTARNRLILRPN